MNSKEPDQNHIMQKKLEKTGGFSDEEILREFEEAMMSTEPLPLPPPPENEFETICQRVEAERTKGSARSGRHRWKRAAAVGLLAAALTGSGCFVALGRKGYFYRERDMGGVTILENDTSMLKMDSEEEAYKSIEDQLGIKALRFGYRPYELIFETANIEEGVARLRYTMGNKNIFLIQSKYEKESSFNHKADLKEVGSVENRWLGKNLKIYNERLLEGGVRYETSFIIDGVYYRLTANISESEFLDISKNLIY